jgi:hypothetical protein
MVEVRGGVTPLTSLSTSSSSNLPFRAAGGGDDGGVDSSSLSSTHGAKEGLSAPFENASEGRDDQPLCGQAEGKLTPLCLWWHGWLIGQAKRFEARCRQCRDCSGMVKRTEEKQKSRKSVSGMKFIVFSWHKGQVECKFEGFGVGRGDTFPVLL